MKKSKSSSIKRNVLNKNKFAFILITVCISISFFELQIFSYVTAISTGLKPGDVIVYDYLETSSYYDTNMSLVDYYKHMSNQILKNISAVRNFGDCIEIDYILQLQYENTEENYTLVLNSTLPLGAPIIPQEYNSFNISDAEFFNYLDYFLSRSELVMMGDSPEGNITWDHKILANGFGFQINANYTNFKYNYTKEYHFSSNFYYSHSGVLLYRIHELNVKVPPGYYQDDKIFWVWSKKICINETMSNFDGKNERPWDPNYIYLEDGEYDRENKFISLTPLEFGSVFVVTIFFLTRKGKNHHYFVK